ncbi:MAG: RluA family pseudouridine synthase [bacterium]
MVTQIDHTLSGQRLDQYLKNLFPNLSRAHIQKIIKGKSVLIGDKPQNSSYNLRGGDILTYDEKSFLSNESSSGEIDIIAEDIHLDKIYEDDNLLVINKPQGLVVHPGAGNLTGTVVNALANMFKGAFLNNSRFGLIHRIDKDTSGLLMIAKNENALNYYSSLFEKREIRKTYLCVVNAGIKKILDKEGKLKVEGYIKRSSHDRKKMQFQVVNDPNGRYSLTEFELLKSNSKHALLAAHPVTGRTHQIRIHLKSLGYPIIGDNIYTGEKYSRLMLHATKIELKLMNGDNIVLVSEPPEEFNSIFFE